MTGQAKVVLWIGLSLIVVNLAKQWPQIRALIFTKGVTAGGSGSGIGFNPFDIIPGGPQLLSAPKTPPKHRAKMV